MAFFITSISDILFISTNVHFWYFTYISERSFLIFYLYQKNSSAPDKTAPLGAVLSGSELCAPNIYRNLRSFYDMVAMHTYSRRNKTSLCRSVWLDLLALTFLWCLRLRHINISRPNRIYFCLNVELAVKFLLSLVRFWIRAFLLSAKCTDCHRSNFSPAKSKSNMSYIYSRTSMAWTPLGPWK